MVNTTLRIAPLVKIEMNIPYFICEVEAVCIILQFGFKN